MSPDRPGDLLCRGEPVSMRQPASGSCLVSPGSCPRLLLGRLSQASTSSGVLTVSMRAARFSGRSSTSGLLHPGAAGRKSAGSSSCEDVALSPYSPLGRSPPAPPVAQLREHRPSTCDDDGVAAAGAVASSLVLAEDTSKAEASECSDMAESILLSIDAGLAEQICATQSLQDLRRLPLPFEETAAAAEPPLLGTWMIWMVHRVALDDPSLEELDFSTYPISQVRDDPRIMPKLFKVLRGNEHLRNLQLADCDLFGRDHASDLAAALVENRALRVLNVSSNRFEPDDLESVFKALSQNHTLEELHCNNQFSGRSMGWNNFQALGKVMDDNRTLRKLGLDITDKYWRNSIHRALSRNIDLVRKARWEAKQRQQSQD